MARSLSFVYIDGREVEASSARGLIEALREADPGAPGDLTKYLELLCSRGSLVFEVALDVGAPGADLDSRCRHALASLLRHGWLRVKQPIAWPPRPRPRIRPTPPPAPEGVPPENATTNFELV